MFTNPTVEPLKSPKSHPSQAQTAIQVPLHVTSQLKCGKTFRANPFLAYKQNAISQIFTNHQTKPVTIEKLRKKYFGKKVRQISHPQQAIVVHKYAKYLNQISWTEKYHSKPGLRGLIGRNPVTYSIQNYLAVKCIGDLIAIDPDIQVSRTTILRLIFASYPKASLKLDNCLKLSMTKWKSILPCMKGLVKHINLELLSSDDIKKKHEDLFVGFDNLKSFSLHGNQSYPLLDYIPKLVQIQALQYLHINLESTIFGYLPVSFADMCYQIEACKIPKWHIRVRAKFEDIIQDKHNFIFNRIDCLGLGKVYDRPPFGGGASSFHYYGYPIQVTSAFPEVKCLHEKRKKVLELAIVELTKFDIGELLDRFKKLEGLYIRLNDYDYGTNYSPSEDLSLDNWASNLKDVVLSFTRSANPDSTFDHLVSKIKAESPKLETLEIFSCHNINKDYVDQEGILTAKKCTYVIDAPDITGLEKLTSLRYLRLGTIQDLESVLPVLSHLPNLKKLELTLGEPQSCENLEPWDKNLLLSSFGRLEELKVNKVFTTSREWGKGLLQNLKYLQNLQVLELKDSTLDKMSLEMLKLLIEGFCTLRSIKRLNLDALISCDKSQKGKSQLEREEILKDIKGLIREWIESNKCLEEINIGKIKHAEFERIKYKR